MIGVDRLKKWLKELSEPIQDQQGNQNRQSYDRNVLRSASQS